jgi:uncharacterized damage-inducible protein DinB
MARRNVAGRRPLGDIILGAVITAARRPGGLHEAIGNNMNEFDNLIQLYNHEFDGRDYHGHAYNGKSLIDTLEMINSEIAKNENTFEGYSIWEIVLHLAYCKYLVSSIILKNENIKFPFVIGNEGFSKPQKTTDIDWNELIRYLKTIHRKSCIAIMELDKSRYSETIKDWKMTLKEAVLWLCSHDIYHIAQIRNMGIITFRMKKVI